MKSTLKGIFNAIIIVIATIIIVFLVEKSYIFGANSALKKKDYDEAAFRYEMLLKIHPKNNNFVRNYAIALENVEFTLENQRRICDFLEIHKGESYSYMLEQRLAKFKADLDLKIGTNYIDKTLYNNKVMHWEDDAFPLKVYITQSPISEPIKRAFEYWSYATSNFISFTYTDDANEADVFVETSPQAAVNCEGCAYVVAETAPKISYGVLRAMHIDFNEKDPNGRPYTDDEVYRVALHEIGHVLGINGHSTNPSDLMYATGNTESPDFASYHSALTREDINTLNLLYLLAPDISSVAPHNRDLRNKIYVGIILGTTEERMNREIQDAQEYVNNAPNLSIGYLNLGNAYFNAKMNKEALETYNQGLQLAVNNDERYNFAYNMSLVYSEIDKPDKALQYAEYAQKLKRTTEIEQRIHDIKYPHSGIQY